jgi:hypothetical protein
MARRRVWHLNFDADDELSHPAGYAPRRAVVARFEDLAARVEGLVPDGDLVIAEWRPPQGRLAASAEGLEGRAFCPTPRALAVLKGTGAVLPEAPSLEILRRVNHRAFSAELGQMLSGARFVRTLAELEATLKSRTGPWLLKRPFGYAGKGRAKLSGDVIDPSTMPFVLASLAAGEGLQVEPWVDRRVDVALHGFLSQNGALWLGEPTVARVDERGSWCATRRASSPDLGTLERAALLAEAEKTAEALGRARYFGPFGIDAFSFDEGDGNVRFNARCEINARYSMGWAIGMGALRPDL